MQRTFRELNLTAITPSPFNPRRDFTGEDFIELTASIARVGVLEPILVRPVEGDIPFELVAGERRWRACYASAESNGGPDKAVIPAMIQEMDDDLALEIQTIENLQRRDLSGLEEAEAFRIWVDRKGKDAIPELAERTGIKEAYIRRRLMILRLPKTMLDAWGKGDLKFGHLEQLARMDDKQQRRAIFDEVVRDLKNRQVTVADLKRRIARISPALGKARFDIEAEGCLACTQNTSVQMKLFDLGDEKAHCNRPECFKKKQEAHLVKFWNRTKYYRKYGIQSFRFNEDVSWKDYEAFYGDNKPAKKCTSCEHHLAILHIDGESCHDRACFGDKSCFNAVRSTKSSGGNTRKPKSKDGPRVAWHGEHFREVFFQERLPVSFEPVEASSLTVRQVALYSLIRGNAGIHDWYAKLHDVGERFWEDGPYSLDRKALFALIAGMDEEQVSREMKAVSLQAVLSGDYATDERHLVAGHVGIDLTSQWRFTEDYLAKKTKGEMLEFGDRFGLFEDPMAMAFLTDTLKRKSFKACKKGELIRVFLESGADTAGMVPDEILDIDSTGDGQSV
ncbi:ParB/RepB/Spo0J family partition protein [uncultured Desulfosarcina sp.]|uniref:ParB/RepB/Spo0J family partition protein n=1 Tax=uncultured Desulfosarcina sp. TaxID=218289 RepID=UPI0029C99701|nr:ParB/RepB/Spo0J family partition protein [uncultured Desulfosarcina sp.]